MKFIVHLVSTSFPVHCRQGRPTMWALQDSPGVQGAPRWLALSSELAGATSLLDVGTGSVLPADILPGLQLEAASLLVANLPGSRALQVTAQVLPLPLLELAD